MQRTQPSSRIVQREAISAELCYHGNQMTSAIDLNSRTSVDDLEATRRAVRRVLRGKPAVIDLVLIGLLAEGHVLIEDIPGVGKTTLAAGLARAVGGQFRRIQFTSDLLPSDVIGTMVYDKESSSFAFHKGPIFTNILLVDEINRASPRTQSALLEAMSERQVSIDGKTMPLPRPFFVIATQNPHDSIGTFPLPESQLDRFVLRTSIGYPEPSVEVELLLSQDGGAMPPVDTVLDPERLASLQKAVLNVTMPMQVAEYIQAILSATRRSPLLSLGASTRAGISLARAARARALLRGRDYCIPEDVHSLATVTLSHRVRVASDVEGYEPTRNQSEKAIRELLHRVPVPV